mgnify:FL=1
MHALETMFPSISLQFQIVSNYIRIHALETLISFFSAVQNRFKYSNVRIMKVQRPICNNYILNTERKVFNYLNFVVESLYYFKGEYLFLAWQTLQNMP